MAKPAFDKIVDNHPDPTIWIGPDESIVHANKAAKREFGPIGRDKTCHEWIYGRKTPCKMCCRDAVGDAADGIVRRLRKVRPRGGQKSERQCLAVDCSGLGFGQVHSESYSPLSDMRLGVRDIMRFGRRLDEFKSAKKVFEGLVEFLGAPGARFPWRVRLYLYEKGRPNALRLAHHDQREDPPYLPNLVGRELQRTQPQGQERSFLAVDDTRHRWYILTPDWDKREFFRLHFNAKAREDDENILDALYDEFSPPLSLCLYDSKTDNIAQMFATTKPHTWLDVPIVTHDQVVGKLSVSLRDDSVLFFRERLEEMVLLETYIRRRLEAIRALDMERRLAIRNVMHEVAQPAFAGLVSMEALRRRDKENGRTAGREPVEYYLKKNVECSLKMVAFLNDRGRITEETSSYAEYPCNLLADVLAPVVNLQRFSIYERYLRDSGATARPAELQDVPVIRHGDDRVHTIRSVCGDREHLIEYDQECDQVQPFVEKYRLQQAFFNLVNNAYKYRDRSRPFHVQIDFRDYMPPELHSDFQEYFVIDVSDDGSGVVREDAERIFQLDTQGRDAQKISRVAGTGRGLYVCRAILRGMGGDLLLWKLRDPTVFRILIPRKCAVSNWPDIVGPLRRRTNEIVARWQKGRGL
jgi:signal transduction histidine kinase